MIFVALLIAAAGAAVVFYGHKVENEYAGVSLVVPGGAALILAILWLGDLLGFQAGLDSGKILFIIKAGVAVWALAMLLIWARIEDHLKGLLPGAGKSSGS